MSDDQTDNPNTPEASSVSNVSGGVNVNAEHDVNVHGDVVGRDKITQIINNFFQGNTAQRDLRNRRSMLELVKNTWVKGVLKKSLYHEMMLDLGLEERPGEVQRPWDMTLHMPDCENRPLPQGTKIMQVFDEMNQALLILGEPGSGKTTMLLELARDTIARAEQDPTQPIPVVFNLSSWSDPKQSIADWLVKELRDKYDVHKKIAQPWIDKDDLLLLFDGLDELRPERREACIKTINDFRIEHGQTQLVVCSRVAEYETLATQLKLRGAVLIQPLTTQQIDEYLETAVSSLSAVREALQRDAELQQLAQSPLMLSVMSLAYSGQSIDNLMSELGDSTRRRKHLLDAYVSRMFTRTARTQHEVYPREQTVHWLICLAQRMTEHAQTVFLIERMQPDWLPTRKHRSLYGLCVMLSVVLPVGLFVGLGCGLPVALSGFSAVGRTFGLTVGLSFGMAVWLAIRGLASGPVGGLFVGLAFGSAFWLAFSQVFGPEIGRPVGLAVGLVAGVAFLLVSRRPTGWSAADRDQIESVETLSWSWSNAASGLVSGLITGFLLGLIVWLAVGQYFGLVFGLVFGLALGAGFGLAAGLFRGLTGVEMEMSTAPNQGILRSAQNALTIGLSVCMGVGLFVGLASGLAWSLAFGPDTGLTIGLVTGVSIGLGFGIAVGLFFGGLTCIKHIMLRLILYHNGLIPWSYAHFLDYAADRIFLRKVGGGYIFIHRIVMEYFASLDVIGRDKVIDAPPKRPGCYARFGKVKLFIVLAILIMIVLGGFFLLRQPPVAFHPLATAMTKPPTPTMSPPSASEVTLTNLQEGQETPCSSIAKGTYPLDLKDEIWPIVYVGGRYFPQDEGGRAAQKISGNWLQTVRFGDCNNPQADVGKPFQLVIVTADESANAEVEKYIKAGPASGKWPGMVELPPGATEQLRISVIRK